MLFNPKIIITLQLVTCSFLFSSGVAFARGDSDQQDCKNTFNGVYIGKILGRTTFTMSNIPLDKANNNMLVVIDTTGDADPTARGLFPTAIGQTHPRGQLVRNAVKDKNYQGQLVRYRYDQNGEVAGTEIQGVSLEILDCKTIEISFVADVFYFGYVNPGMEELPVPDVNVDVSGFLPFIANRIIIDHKF